MVFATVTGDDDVPILQSNPSVRSRNQVYITPLTGEPDKLTGESESVTLGNTTRAPDVSPCTLFVPFTDSISCQFL